MSLHETKIICVCPNFFSTNYLILPIIYSLGTEISVPGIGWTKLQLMEGAASRAFPSEQKECKIVDLNIQIDHVHLLVVLAPKISMPDYVEMIRGGPTHLFQA